MRENKTSDAIRIAPRPKAETAKYRALPVMTPSAPNRLAFAPERRACDMTRRTAGPGERDSKNSVLAKSTRDVSNIKTLSPCDTVEPLRRSPRLLRLHRI